jgi:hypothetical protein
MGINLGLQRMLENACAGRLACLVVESADRLSRSLPIGPSILSELEASGIKVRSVVGEPRVEPVTRTRNAKKLSIDGEKKPAVRKQQTGRRPAKIAVLDHQTFPPDTNANSEG